MMDQMLRDAAEGLFAPRSPASSDVRRSPKADRLAEVRTALRAQEQAAKDLQKQARLRARATSRYSASPIFQVSTTTR